MEIDKHFADNQKLATCNGPHDVGGPDMKMVRGTRALRDIADDLATLQIPTVTSPDAPAAAGSYTQADIQAMVTLLNEIKTKLNAIAAATILTTKV